MEGSVKPGWLEIKWCTSVSSFTDDVNIVGRSACTTKKNTEVLIVSSKETGLEVMLLKLSTWSCLEIRMQDKVTI